MTIDQIFDTNAAARRIAASYFDESNFGYPGWLDERVLPLKVGYRLLFSPVKTWGVWDGYVTMSLAAPDGTVLDIEHIDSDNIRRFS